MDYWPLREFPPVPETVIRQAEILRLNGIEYYKKKRFGAAIDAFTEAIVLNPSVASNRMRRAQCFLNLSKWARVEEDCRIAIELEPSSLECHYLLGNALVERKAFAEGIKILEKTLVLGKARDSEDDIMEGIWDALLNAKYMNWELESNARSCKLHDLREACTIALEEQYINNGTPCYDDHVLLESKKIYMKRLDCLGRYFDEMEAKNKHREVPDYLCCKITLEICRDPVITPSGITYERSAIIDHLHKVGRFDPTTREPLEPHHLVPNLAMKEAVQAFLDQNGWAYKACYLLQPPLLAPPHRSKLPVSTSRIP